MAKEENQLYQSKCSNRTVIGNLFNNHRISIATENLTLLQGVKIYEVFARKERNAACMKGS